MDGILIWMPGALGALGKRPLGVFFGDHKDTAQNIPVREKQTNNRGECGRSLRNLAQKSPATLLDLL